MRAAVLPLQAPALSAASTRRAPRCTTSPGQAAGGGLLPQYHHPLFPQRRPGGIGLASCALGIDAPNARLLERAALNLRDLYKFEFLQADGGLPAGSAE